MKCLDHRGSVGALTTEGAVEVQRWQVGVFYPRRGRDSGTKSEVVVGVHEAGVVEALGRSGGSRGCGEVMSRAPRCESSPQQSGVWDSPRVEHLTSLGWSRVELQRHLGATFPVRRTQNVRGGRVRRCRNRTSAS